MNKALQKSEAAPSAVPMLTPAQMVMQAIEQGAGVEVMEKLLDMQARWEAMQAKKAFDNAMADLRSNMPSIVKDKQVDFTTSKGRTNYRYEDLDTVSKALSPVMAGLGLSFRFRTESNSGNVTVTCIITHRDGHAEETSLSAPFDTTGNKNAIQAIGSATTYLQRYTLKAAVGIAASVDDDGQSAGPRPDETSPAPRKADARAIYTQAEHDIRSTQTREDLKTVWSDIPWDQIPADWKKDLVKEKDAKLAEFTRPKVDDDAFPGDMPTEEPA